MTEPFFKDDIYATALESLIDFSFDKKTVSVFPDMINRSVPGYSLMQSVTGLLASQSVTPGSRVYDLGCSLGASALSVANSVAHNDYEMVLVDQSAPMLAECKTRLADKISNLDICQQDVRSVAIENASFVMLNLVLQFLPLTARQNLLDKIYCGLNLKGALILSEKICGQTDAENKYLEEVYYAFKKRSGYSDLEISQKRQALEKVMQIESITKHQERLHKAGFSTVMPIMQALNFVSLLAVK